MRRVPSVLLVAAVAALAVAAAVDALRNGSETLELAAPRERSAPAFAAAASALRAAGVAGTLVLSDEECRLRALRLPALRPAPASRIQRCEPHVPTGGVGAFDGDVVWAGLGVGVVQVLVSQEELTRALRRRGHEAAGGFRAREAVPLVGGRHAVMAEAGGDRLLVFLADGRVERVVEGFLGGADSLRPSPGGRYVALFEAREEGMRLFSANGRELGLPDVNGPRAIAWSPDERWTALATRASVFVYATDDPAGALVRIPVAARDLDWEADELLAAATELREAGLRGVLTYSDEDCRLHSLALPDLAAHPAPPERRCRLPGVVRLRFGRPVGDPQRIVLARCRAGGRVVVSELGGRTLAGVPGCSPSWREDGTLTAVREGELVSLFPARVLLGRADLARELERDAGKVELVEAAWLSGTRLAAVVRVAPAGEEPDVFAVFEGGRLVGRPVAFGTGLSGLRTSPNGRYAAARSSRGGIVLDREGRRVGLPVGVAAITWSQDEEWIAATRGDEIAFFPLDEPASPGIELPLAARDLIWR